nr:casp-like protein 4c2 [Quercus suber]
MRSPQALLNGENPSPHRRNSNFSTPLATPHHPASHFQSTVTVHKLRRFNSLILLFRIAAFCFSLTSFVFMITTNSRSSSSSPHWYDFDAFSSMRSPQALLNGENPSPHRRNSNFSTPLATPHHPASHFQSTVTVHKLRRFNSLILLFRIAAFCFSLTSFVFMITTNSRSSSSSPHWYDFDAFRFVLAANAIVAVYSLFEMVASVWEISRDTTLFPESLQVWFDFGHDQVQTLTLLISDF